MTTINDLIAQVRGQIPAKLAERNGCADALAAMARANPRGVTDPTAAWEVARLRGQKDALDAEIDAMNARVKELEAEQANDEAADRLSRESYPTGVTRDDKPSAIRVGSGPHTYERGSSFSFLSDLYAAQVRNDPDAMGRLHQHGREMAVDGGLSERALTSGGVAAFVPPAYLQAEWAELVRAGRQTADLCRSLPLPSHGMTVNIPKLSTGTSTAVQGTENTAVSETNADDTQIAASVTTIAGQQTLSRQLLERSDPGMDVLILGDLANAYAAALDVQVLNGTSPMVGILQTSGINAVTYTDASPTVPEIYPKLADALQRVTGGRYAAPTGWVMHPRRWAWFLAAADTAGRPLVVPGPTSWNGLAIGTGNMAGYGSAAVGELLGVPVYLDANIPTNLGAGTNEDRIILAVWDDQILLEENGGTPHLLQFEAPAAASLSVLLVAYGFSAFTAARQPAGISVISGTGLVTPTW